MMKAQIAAAIQAVVRLQLDDCKRAIKNGTRTIALNELEDAIRQLKLPAKRLKASAAICGLGCSGEARAKPGCPMGRRTRRSPTNAEPEAAVNSRIPFAMLSA